MLGTIKFCVGWDSSFISCPLNIKRCLLYAYQVDHLAGFTLFPCFQHCKLFLGSGNSFFDLLYVSVCCSHKDPNSFQTLLSYPDPLYSREFREAKAESLLKNIWISIHPSLLPSIHSSTIHPSTYPPTYPSIHSTICIKHLLMWKAFCLVYEGRSKKNKLLFLFFKRDLNLKGRLKQKGNRRKR